MGNGIFGSTTGRRIKSKYKQKIWSDSIPDHWTQVSQPSALPSTQNLVFYLFTKTVKTSKRILYTDNIAH